MTTLTNSEGKILNYTNEFLETILLQLNSSNNYYTTGDDDIIFIKIGSTKVLLLDYTYHINRNIFQNYNINENTINDYGLEFILKNTSNEYTLQGVYTANSYIGTINTLQDVYLAIYDTAISPTTYTGSENIDITENQISLNFPLKINDEIVMHPRAYGNVFDMISGTDMFSFRQNSIHGSTIIAQFFSETKQCIVHGDCEIPNIYNKTSTDNLITQIYDDVYLKLEIDGLITNINISNYYDKTYIDNLDDELSALILDTYTKTEVDTLLTNNQFSLTYPLKINDETFLNPRVNGYFELYAGTSGFAFLQNIVDGSQPIAIFNSLDKSVEFFGDLDIPNFYNKAEVDTLFSNLNLVNYYNKSQVDAIISNIDLSSYYTKTEIDTQLTDYATISYLQGNYMTTLAITETLMNNYPSLTLISDNFYDKPYLDNQFSLKADASTTITTDYLTTNYTDTVALTSGFYNKTETDTMLLSYSTGSYVDANLSLKADSSQLSSFASLDYLHLKYIDSVDIASTYYNKTENDNLLANKVSTTGDATLNGNLKVNGTIRIEPTSTFPSVFILDQSNSTDFGDNSYAINVFGRNGDGHSRFKFYNSRGGSNCNVLIDGNLDVGSGGVISTATINLTNTEQYNFPLVISNNGGNWFQGEYLANNNNVGCLFRYKTSASTDYWWSGVWGSNTNEFKILFVYKGLSIKSNGNAVLTGSLTQNSDASLKDNVQDVDLTDCTNMLENINVKTYTRNDMEEGNQRLGFIAQDVKAYLPDKFDNIIGSNIITDEQGENSKEIMTMDYARMVCVLWKIVQNQNERIKALESK